jgi:hypothetical protein
MNRALRHLAVLLVGIHLVAITLQALPSPNGGLQRADWAQPTVQGELSAWAGRLQAVGVALTPSDLEEGLFSVAVKYARWHQAVIAPFQPYYRYAGTTQSWRMFVAPHRYPSRMQVRIYEGTTWQVVYEERHPTARWMGTALDHDRFRAAIFRYGWGQKYPRQFADLVAWLQVYAARDFPEATRLEVRFLGGKTPSPEEARAGAGRPDKVTRSKVVPLGDG